jgi:hypothetical protein
MIKADIVNRVADLTDVPRVKAAPPWTPSSRR